MSEQIELLREILEATKDIIIIKEKLDNFNKKQDDFNKRLQGMEIRYNKIWHQKGIQFMNDHGHKIEGIVEIFNKPYGNFEKILGYDLITNVLNSFAKSKERKRIFFTSVINSLAFRFIQVICIIILFLLYFFKDRIIGK